MDFIKSTDHRPTEHLPTEPLTTNHWPNDPPTQQSYLRDLATEIYFFYRRQSQLGKYKVLLPSLIYKIFGLLVSMKHMRTLFILYILNFTAAVLPKIFTRPDAFLFQFIVTLCIKINHETTIVYTFTFYKQPVYKQLVLGT